ncbi:MAG: hypothetical protein OXG91_12275, partial [bacterium]|nr:hypothetical protein [bacterium]
GAVLGGSGRLVGAAGPSRVARLRVLLDHETEITAPDGRRTASSRVPSNPRAPPVSWPSHGFRPALE